MEPTMTSRETYVAKMKLQLDELNSKMTEMEGKAKLARAEARDAYRAELDKLHDRSKQALVKLDEMGKAGEATWDAMVVEMDKVRDAFVHSFHDFKARI
jgi:predicted  nucleic acid-binding Zn-ribbon protein